MTTQLHDDDATFCVLFSCRSNVIIISRITLIIEFHDKIASFLSFAVLMFELLQGNTWQFLFLLFGLLSQPENRIEFVEKFLLQLFFSLFSSGSNYESLEQAVKRCLV